MAAWLTTSCRPVPRTTTRSCRRRTGPDRRIGQPRRAAARTTTTTPGGTVAPAVLGWASTRRRRCRTHHGRTSAARCRSSRTSRSRRTCRAHHHRHRPRHRHRHRPRHSTSRGSNRRHGRSDRSGPSTTVSRGARSRTSGIRSRIRSGRSSSLRLCSNRRSRGGLVRSVRGATAHRRTGHRSLSLVRSSRHRVLRRHLNHRHLNHRHPSRRRHSRAMV
jgi:hypothetical protein